MQSGWHGCARSTCARLLRSRVERGRGGEQRSTSASANGHLAPLLPPQACQRPQRAPRRNGRKPQRTPNRSGKHVQNKLETRRVSRLHRSVVSVCEDIHLDADREPEL